MHRTRMLIFGGRSSGVYLALEMERHLARRADVEMAVDRAIAGAAAS